MAAKSEKTAGYTTAENYTTAGYTTISLCMLANKATKELDYFLKHHTQPIEGIQLVGKVHLVDEIVIVVDSGKEKDFEYIKKKYKARIVPFVWCDDFGKARNEGLKHATKDWILVLDIDEVISTKDFERIKRLAGMQDFDAYFLMQRQYTNEESAEGFMPTDNYAECKNFKGFYSSMIIRLFRNNKGYFFDYAGHERVDRSIEEKNGRIGIGDVPIHHYGLIDPEVKQQKIDRGLRIGLKQIKLTPNNPKPFYEIAQVYQYLGRFDEAIKSYKKAISLDEKYEHSLIYLAALLKALDRKGEALTYYERAVKVKPSESAFVELASLYFELGKQDLGTALLEESLKKYPKWTRTYNAYSSALIKRADYEKAIEVLKQAIKNNPANKGAYNNLGLLLMKIGRFDDTEKLLKAGIAVSPKEKTSTNIRLYSSLAGLYLKKQMPEDAEKLLRKALSIDSKSSLIYCNLIDVLLAKKDVATARKVLDAAKKAGCSDERLEQKKKLIEQ